MKLLKIFLLLLILISTLFIYDYFINSKIALKPISAKNNYYKNLELAINTANLTISSYQIRDYNNEVEFYLIDNDQPIKILLSTLKDPFWQVSTLQQVVKKAKINQEKIKLVDLSSQHPYVTFKNN